MINTWCISNCSGVMSQCRQYSLIALIPKKIKERNAEYPAVSEEETYRYHGQWHVDVRQYINPDDAVSV